MSDPGSPPGPPGPPGPPPPPAPLAKRFYIQTPFGEVQGPYPLADLRGYMRTGHIKPSTMVRPEDRDMWLPASQVPGLVSDKSFITAVILSLLGFIGVAGIDRFYLGYTGLGVAKLLTVGGCGIWTLIDLILLATRKIPDSEGLPLASGS